MSDMGEVPDFIEDGHLISFVWDRDEVKVSDIYCPHLGGERPGASLCTRQRSYCVVERFVGIHGYELNVGRTIINGPVEIVWVPMAGESDLDSEFSGIFIAPANDVDYLELKDMRGREEPEE